MDSYEGIDKLRLGEVADPHPNQGEVLVAVRFAALDPADAFLAHAQYPAKPSLPHILGRDGCGVVREIHPIVKSVRVGDSVGILPCHVGADAWGTLAEQVLPLAIKLASRHGDFGKSVCDVAKVAGENLRAACRAMDLRANPVEFVLNPNGSASAEPGPNRAAVGLGTREHTSHGLKQGQLRLKKATYASQQRRPPDVPEEHVRLPDRGGFLIKGSGDGILEEALL